MILSKVSFIVEEFFFVNNMMLFKKSYFHVVEALSKTPIIIN